MIRMAEEDPEMILVRLAKEEEAVGISAGAHFAGVKSAMLMQNHGFLAAINGIVSFAQLYRIPLLMIISYRGHFGERDPWQTQGGAVPEPLPKARGIRYEFLPDPARVCPPAMVFSPLAGSVRNSSRIPSALSSGSVTAPPCVCHGSRPDV